MASRVLKIVVMIRPAAAPPAIRTTIFTTWRRDREDRRDDSRRRTASRSPGPAALLRRPSARPRPLAAPCPERPAAARPGPATRRGTARPRRAGPVPTAAVPVTRRGGRPPAPGRPASAEPGSAGSASAGWPAPGRHEGRQLELRTSTPAAEPPSVPASATEPWGRPAVGLPSAAHGDGWSTTALLPRSMVVRWNATMVPYREERNAGRHPPPSRSARCGVVPG
jgi:hypothetical protein